MLAHDLNSLFPIGLLRPNSPSGGSCQMWSGDRSDRHGFLHTPMCVNMDRSVSVAVGLVAQRTCKASRPGFYFILFILCR